MMLGWIFYFSHTAVGKTEQNKGGGGGGKRGGILLELNYDFLLILVLQEIFF